MSNHISTITPQSNIKMTCTFNGVLQNLDIDILKNYVIKGLATRSYADNQINDMKKNVTELNTNLKSVLKRVNQMDEDLYSVNWDNVIGVSKSYTDQKAQEAKDYADKYFNSDEIITRDSRGGRIHDLNSKDKDWTSSNYYANTYFYSHIRDRVGNNVKFLQRYDVRNGQEHFNLYIYPNGIRDGDDWAAWSFDVMGLHTYNDARQSIGAPNYKLNIGYFKNGVQTTSDARHKNTRAMTPQEIKVTKKMPALIDVFKWKQDGDRLHCGPTVQDVMQAFKECGLEPFDHAAICFDKWDAKPEKKDEEGNIIEHAQEAGDIYSFRDKELVMLMIRGLHENLQDEIKARESLEARIAKLESK